MRTVRRKKNDSLKIIFAFYIQNLKKGNFLLNKIENLAESQKIRKEMEIFYKNIKVKNTSNIISNFNNNFDKPTNQ